MAEGIDVEVSFDGLMAEKALKRGRFNCIILDVNLPGKNGYEVCRSFRSYNSGTPVIMLTAFSELEDKVEGFDAGADDYLSKPFYMRELLIRVQSLIKRNKRGTSINPESPIIIADDIVVYTTTKTVKRQNIEIQLTPREYQILLKLIESKGELVSKKDLIKEVWGTMVDVNTNTIEVFINFLRNKVDKPFGKQSIKTKSGFGYYFDEK